MYYFDTNDNLQVARVTEQDDHYTLHVHDPHHKDPALEHQTWRSPQLTAINEILDLLGFRPIERDAFQRMVGNMTARLVGHPIHVVAEHHSLSLVDSNGDWTISTTLDPEVDQEWLDEPYVAVPFNSAGEYHDPELGPAVDRAFDGTSIEAHERLVLQWLNAYRATQQGVDEEPARLFEESVAPAYAEHEETDYAALTGIYDG